MGLNEAVRNINVQKYLEEKDGFGDGGRFNKPFKIDYEEEGKLLATQEKIQSKKIEEALKKGREKTIKKANKELDEIVKKGNKRLRKVRKQIDKLIGERRGGSGGGGNGGGAGPH